MTKIENDPDFTEQAKAIVRDRRSRFDLMALLWNEIGTLIEPQEILEIASKVDGKLAEAQDGADAIAIVYVEIELHGYSGIHVAQIAVLVMNACCTKLERLS
jgi:hypothetical protein